MVFVVWFEVLLGRVFTSTSYIHYLAGCFFVLFGFVFTLYLRVLGFLGALGGVP